MLRFSHSNIRFIIRLKLVIITSVSFLTHVQALGTAPKFR